MAGTTQAIKIVLDGQLDLTAGAGRFVEVETDDGRRISIGVWTERPDGYWSLRIDGVYIPQQPSTTTRPDEAPTVNPLPKKATGQARPGWPVDVELSDAIPPRSNRARWL